MPGFCLARALESESWHFPAGKDATTFGLVPLGDFSRLGLMSQMEKKVLSSPDEKRSFDKGQVELVT